MKRNLFTIILTLFTGVLFSQTDCDTATIYSNTTSNAVCFDTIGTNVYGCYSNNFPDHEDSYNSPFTVEASNEEYYMCLYPDTAVSFTPLYEATETALGCNYTYQFGVAINGIGFTPNSNETFVDTLTGENNIEWHKEARYMFNANFGNNGGHINAFGSYHYHDVPIDYFTDSLGITGAVHSSIVGYAADGFPIYYKYVYTDANNAGSGITGYSSGYSLKSGTRPGDGESAPDGAYSGLYYEDYEYSTSELDECNGRYGITPDYPAGTYYYVLTDNYPYIPRCFKGTVLDNTFRSLSGCPDSEAATECSAPSVAISGCMDPFSCNYDASATVDDGSCDYAYTYLTTTESAADSMVSPSGNYTWYTSGTYNDTIVSVGCDTVYTVTATITVTSSSTTCSLEPVITNWELNTTGKTASYWENTGMGTFTFNTTTDLADVLSVCYDEDTVWITSEGMTNDMGQFQNPGSVNPQGYRFKFPRNPVAGSGTDEVPTENSMGVLLNGIPMYGLSDGTSYHAGLGSNEPNGDGNWVGDAYWSEGFTLDTAFAAHPQQAGAYHSHATPFRYYDDPDIKHSPLVGYANDGFPVYGPFGYSTASDSSSGAIRMVSGYQLRNITTRDTLPDGSPSMPPGPAVTSGGSFDIGTFVEDYEYLGTGTLDEHNGRLCVTPEYPGGTYAYFVTVDAAGTPQFPYYVGTTYYGTGIDDNNGGSVSAPTSVTCYDGSTCPSPVADFNAGSTAICEGESTVFTDASTETPSSWAWSFSPNTVTYINTTSATSQNPEVQFDASGTYQVTLNSTNASGNGVETKATYITVSPATSFTAQPSDDGVCNGANSSFTITADNAGALKWQENTGAGWNDLSNGGIYSGVASSTLSLTGVTGAMDNYTYRCRTRISSCNEDTSNVATLTINTSVNGTDVQSSCGSYTWIDGMTYKARNNSATHTLVGGSVNGCDSIVTLDLTINTSVNSTDVQSACGSYTWIDGMTYNASNNSATHTIVGGSVNGCDSIVTLDLTINTSVNSTDVQSACGSYTWIDGMTYNTSNNSATHTIVGGSVNGCDSIVTLDLTINTSVNSTDVQSACGSYTWIDGMTYNTSNNSATHTLVGGSVNGCDSIVTLDLTLTPTVDLTITNSAPILTSNQAGATYRWLDCNNGNAVIPSETAQSYTVTATGDYAVEISIGSCIDTTACESVIISSIENNNVSGDMNIYPNPTNGQITIELNNTDSEGQLKVFDMLGNVVLIKQLNNNKTVVNLTGRSKGIYFINIETNTETLVRKVILQ